MTVESREGFTVACPEGALRIHPDDAEGLGLESGDLARCRSRSGQLTVRVQRDERLRRGVVSLPHGYGLTYAGEAPVGPQLNRLTSASHCDPVAATPFHKYVPVQLQAAE